MKAWCRTWDLFAQGDNGMIYHKWDKLVYRNSRYELIALLEGICPTGNGKIETMESFEEIAEHYERLLDESFPSLLLSEERLAIFSHVYSKRGVISHMLIQAIASGSRAVIFSALYDVENGANQDTIALERRRFYEAAIFDNE